MDPSRLSTYRLIAAAPLAAVASGASADIVYTELDSQIGGPGPAPARRGPGGLPAGVGTRRTRPGAARPGR